MSCAEAFGPRIAKIVAEVTDDKNLSKAERKRMQLDHAAEVSPEAKQLKIADKLCNLRDILSSPPTNWPPFRKQQYFEWAKQVVDQVRDANPRLAAQVRRGVRAAVEAVTPPLRSPLSYPSPKSG